jgi:DNA-binding NarL/FixJ family response regulator
MMKRLKKRVLLVDRSLMLKDELNRIESQMEDYVIVGMYKDVRSAYLSLLRSRPEIIVISIYEWDETLLTTIGKIKNQYPSIKLLIQSEVDDDNLIFDLLTIGLSGFVTHQPTWPDLKKQLDDIVSGDCPTSALITKKIFEVFQLNKFSELSSRQNEVLRLMLMGGTYNSIAERLRISKETAKTHMKNLYRKLDVHSKEQALAKAVEEKLILVI